MPLREITLLPTQFDGCCVVASKVPADGIDLSTLIKMDEKIGGFATIDGRAFDLINGRTVEYSYSVSSSCRIGLFDRRKVKISVYSYTKGEIRCSLGIKDLSAKDIDDGKEKILSGYWDYSLVVREKEKLINFINEDGVLMLDECINIMNTRGGIRDIAVGVIMKTLETTPFNKLCGKMADIAHAVIQDFGARNGDVKTPFNITNFSLGDMKIRLSEDTGSDVRSASPCATTNNGERFGGALNGYGTSIGSLLGSNENSTPAASQSVNDVSGVISIVERATVEVNSITFDQSVKGTGFIVMENGKKYLVTNCHVIKDAYKQNGVITVKFSDKVNSRRDNLRVTVASVDPVNDLAILEPRFEIPNKATFLQLADISTLMNGQAVISVGHPEEFSFEAIYGIISQTTINMGEHRFSGIVCELPAAHGNSGGAVVRVSDCSVVGIATEIKNPETMQSRTICASADAIRAAIYDANINNT